jgi:hypothetical protein
LAIDDAVVVLVVDFGQSGSQRFGFLDHGLHVIARLAYVNARRRVKAATSAGSGRGEHPFAVS